MSTEFIIRHCPPEELGGARVVAHSLLQLLTRAARANRPAQADDSHASLMWDSKHQQFMTLPLAATIGDYQLGLSLPSLDRPVARVTWIRAGVIEAQRDPNGISNAAALVWLDELLTGVGLQPATPVVLPYALPADVENVDFFEIKAQAAALASLAGWFDFAASVLRAMRERHSGIKPGAGPIWVWPHHFDIASYIRLSDSDADTAPGIGVGLSPGDESYHQPYLYVNPWPRPDTRDLPDAPAPGHWHTTGFVGTVATAQELLATPEPSSAAVAFTNNAVALARNLLAA